MDRFPVLRSLRWSRHYRGGRDESGLCGPQWQTPADIRLEREVDGVVLFHHPEQMALFPQPPQAPGLEHVTQSESHAGDRAAARDGYLRALGCTPPDDTLMAVQEWAYDAHPRRQIDRIDGIAAA